MSESKFKLTDLLQELIDGHIAHWLKCETREDPERPMDKCTCGLREQVEQVLALAEAEIEADPLDLEEWIDVVMLAVDGYCRAGGDPREFFDRLQAKHAKNLAREWPENTSQDEPVEHIRDFAKRWVRNA